MGSVLAGKRQVSKAKALALCFERMCFSLRLKQRGVVLYGAGQMAAEILKLALASPGFPRVAAIVDDRAKPGQTLGGHPVIPPGCLPPGGAEPVLLATDAFEDILWARAKDAFGDSREILRLSGVLEELGISAAGCSAEDSAPWPMDFRIWRRAYEDYLNGGDCADFKDCVVLAAVRAAAPMYNDERAYEYGFIEKRLGSVSPCRMLDVGSGASSLPKQLLARGFEIVCVDPAIQDGVSADGIIQRKADIRATDFKSGDFMLATCVSTIEHIGVPGRYGITELDPTGDQKAVGEIARVLGEGGLLFLTVPMGVRPILPINRVYTHERILSFASGMELLDSQFFFPDGKREAYACDAAMASSCDWYKEGYYALGCYMFRKMKS